MKRYFIKTYGCKLNQSETDNLTRVLDNNFLKSSEKEADFIVFNSCGVVKKTERKIIKEIKKQRRRGKKIIVTGCLPKINKKVKEIADISIEGNDSDDFMEKISNLYPIKDNSFSIKIPVITDPKSVSAIIPISTGCLGNCSYCGAKIARGSLKSFPQEEIVKTVKKVLDEGKKEIQLTSQDLGIYGKDTDNYSFLTLINQLISLDYDFKIKFGMMNPAGIKGFCDQFLELFESEKDI